MKEGTKDKIRLGIMDTIIVVLIAWAIMATYWTISTPKIITVQEPMPIIGETVLGGILHYEVDYCKYKATQIELSPLLIGANGNPHTVVPEVNGLLTGFKSNFDVGCGVFTSSVVTIPLSAPCGDYYLLQTAKAKPNPIKPTTLTFKSEIFTIQCENQ